jgi:hypothetical protein
MAADAAPVSGVCDLFARPRKDIGLLAVFLGRLFERSSFLFVAIFLRVS